MLVTSQVIPLLIALLAHDHPATAILATTTTTTTMILIYRLTRSILITIILIIAIAVGVAYGYGSKNPVQGAIIADLLLATGWLWALNTTLNTTRKQ